MTTPHNPYFLTVMIAHYDERLSAPGLPATVRQFLEESLNMYTMLYLMHPVVNHSNHY